MEARTNAAGAELLDVRAVARLLGCSCRHVTRMTERGEMPRGRKLGALRRWSRSEVLDWIAGGCPRLRPERGPAR
ncbi:MAG: helix-turn-helix domain-containing protein [Phycisphaerae bacterium]